MSLQNLTVCVSRWWAGRDNVWEQVSLRVWKMLVGRADSVHVLSSGVIRVLPLWRQVVVVRLNEQELGETALAPLPAAAVVRSPWRQPSKGRLQEALAGLQTNVAKVVHQCHSRVGHRAPLGWFGDYSRKHTMTVFTSRVYTTL